MIKTFCDSCDREIAKDEPPLTAFVPLHTQGIRVAYAPTVVEQPATPDAAVCRYCILDAFARQDDRARPA